MQVNNYELLDHLNALLSPQKVRDYCPNGLQVEGKSQINTLVTGVTASQQLIDKAVEYQADAIFVHHGYFWKSENPCITGMKRNRIQTLLANEINLFAYHLPLDVHPELGNNAQLAALLAIETDGGLDANEKVAIAMKGHFDLPISPSLLKQRISQQLARQPLHEAADKTDIRTVAWCTGGGQQYIEQAAEQGIDAFITGEASEQTIHTAREMNIHFYAAGHHATERYGAKAVGEHLAQQFGIDVIFVDIDNPV